MHIQHHTLHSSKVASAFFSTPDTASGKSNPRKAFPRLALRRLVKNTVSDCLVANNRQLHPDEKTLAKQLAEQSKGKYTQEQIEEQMRGMSMTTKGITEAGNPDVIIGTNLGDGTWVKAGETSDGQPIFTQQIAAEDTALRAYIVGNTTHGEIPSLITYGGTYIAPSYSNTPLPMPTAACGGADMYCASGTSRPYTAEEIAAHWNNSADFFGGVSTQADRISAAAAAAAAVPGAHQPAAATVAAAFAMAGLGAEGISQLFRPDPAGMFKDDIMIGIPAGILGNRFPMYSPVINEIGEKFKNGTN